MTTTTTTTTGDERAHEGMHREKNIKKITRRFRAERDAETRDGTPPGRTRARFLEPATTGHRTQHHATRTSRKRDGLTKAGRRRVPDPWTIARHARESRM
jgi:hypothetical protein